jgi:uncharacterized protein YdeI (YjbR/CyaY-like superfamily)
MTDDGVLFFPEPAAWRGWLAENHERAAELWVGYRKRGTGLPSLTWPESVDEALCFGWIDGVRKRIDDVSYKIRFTPRRRGSIWSAVNLRRTEELIGLGLVYPAGLRAYESRADERTAIYAYERAAADLTPEYERRFRADEAAWRYFQSRPPSYRQTTVFWVMSAKQEATRERRLERLIEDSRGGRLSGTFRPASG